MKFITRLVPIIIIVFFNRCNKSQKVVKELEGLWYVTSYTKNGVPATQPGSKVTLNFTKCKVKKGDCDGSITVDAVTVPMTYRISNNGTTYTLTCSVPGVIPTQNGNVTEHTKTNMVFTSMTAGDTYITVLTRN